MKRTQGEKKEKQVYYKKLFLNTRFRITLI